MFRELVESSGMIIKSHPYGNIDDVTEVTRGWVIYFTHYDIKYIIAKTPYVTTYEIALEQACFQYCKDNNVNLKWFLKTNMVERIMKGGGKIMPYWAGFKEISHDFILETLLGNDITVEVNPEGLIVGFQLCDTNLDWEEPEEDELREEFIRVNKTITAIYAHDIKVVYDD
jgi:hypothetical protein